MDGKLNMKLCGLNWIVPLIQHHLCRHSQIDNENKNKEIGLAEGKNEAGLIPGIKGESKKWHEQHNFS